MNDGNEIVTTLTKLFWATDHHDWEGLRRTFAGQVLLDYTATLGGEPRICAPGEVVDGWRPAFEALDAHQHLVANHMVEIADEEATATASFIATHQFQGETWTLGGDYHFRLHRCEGNWRVAAMRMVPVWQTGPVGLVTKALEAAAS